MVATLHKQHDLKSNTSPLFPHVISKHPGQVLAALALKQMFHICAYINTASIEDGFDVIYAIATSCKSLR